jgi:hypothetical protein
VVARGDAECDALAREADERLAPLRSVLRPEPLPATLRQRILAEFDGRGLAPRRRGLPPVHLAWLAAAACLLVAFVLPRRTDVESARSLMSAPLSPNEAAEIVAAYRVLSWDSSADYTLEAVDLSLRSIERTLRREANGTSVLPWGRDDDWDVAPRDDAESLRSRAAGGFLCRAAWRAHRKG